MAPYTPFSEFKNDMRANYYTLLSICVIIKMVDK